MNRIAARRLRPYERQKLHRMKGQLSNTVNSRHARIILLSVGGVANAQIADRCDCTPTWVRAIIHRFNDGGIDAITWYPCYGHDGSPRKFFCEVIEQIAQAALSPPRKLIGMSVWSLSKLRAYLIEQKVVRSISLEWLRHILRRHRIRWRHTKTWKESLDPDFQAKYRRIRRLYGHKPETGRRLCVDEFGPLNLRPRHGMHHARTGHVDRLRATYSRDGGVRHMFGCYDLESGRLKAYFAGVKNQDTFLEFLRWLRASYDPRLRLHIVLDNATYHGTPAVLAYAAAHHITFYWVPTGASWLNRIESHLTAVRKFAMDNTDHRTHEAQQQAIEDYLSWRNQQRKISRAAWPSDVHTRKAA